MQTKNELILDKLIDKRANKISEIRAKILSSGECVLYAEDYNKLQAEWIMRCGFDSADKIKELKQQLAQFDALVSECGKRGYVIKIDDNFLEIKDAEYQSVLIHHAEYSRQSVAEAFCKVVGISEVSDAEQY